MTDWALRYTSHLGYRPPEMQLQFPATVGTTDLTDHIDFVAQVGFAGVLYPWATSRAHDEVVEVAAALRSRNLACSTLVGIPPDLNERNLWSDRSPHARALLSGELLKTIRMAQLLGAEVLALLIGKDPQRADDDQRDDIAGNVRDLAHLASDHGMTVAIEPMTMLSNAYLTTMADGIRFIDAVDHPAAKLIYDTGHVAMAGEDLMGAFLAAYDRIALIQLADLPGRVEPGAGELAIVPVAAEALRRGYGGLVDLEHGWRDEGRDGERIGLDRIKAFDAAVRAAAADV